MKESTSCSQLVEAIQAIGLANSAVCLHSSLKSFGCLDGGADTLIGAFLDEGCTLVVPTFTYACEAAPPPDRQLSQNGLDYSEPIAVAGLERYDKNGTLISPDMGAVPARVLHLKGHVRSNHPLNSFSAIGPLADELIRTQSLLNVYGPLQAMYTHPATYMVLIGVDLTKATPIHFAEEKAGRRLFRRWAKLMDGTVHEVAVGSCSEGFNNLAPAVRELEINLMVGQSKWRVYPFRAFIDTVTRMIVRNPEITHCADVNCVRCNDAIKGGPRL
jgi:aminoglycoside 3-N-acetyltransferase